MKRFKLYFYKGPILIEDNCFRESWRAETVAINKNDAYNRFIMKCRREALDFIDPNIKITLPGQLSEVTA